MPSILKSMGENKSEMIEPSSPTNNQEKASKKVTILPGTEEMLQEGELDESQARQKEQEGKIKALMKEKIQEEMSKFDLIR